MNLQVTINSCSSKQLSYPYEYRQVDKTRAPSLGYFHILAELMGEMLPAAKHSTHSSNNGPCSVPCLEAKTILPSPSTILPRGFFPVGCCLAGARCWASSSSWITVLRPRCCRLLVPMARRRRHNQRPDGCLLLPRPRAPDFASPPAWAPCSSHGLPSAEPCLPFTALAPRLGSWGRRCCCCCCCCG